MFSKTKVALAAAIVLASAFPAAAASRHYRATYAAPLYDMLPDAGGGCSPVHPPLCSNICTGSGPCAPPDSW